MAIDGAERPAASDLVWVAVPRSVLDASLRVADRRGPHALADVPAMPAPAPAITTAGAGRGYGTASTAVPTGRFEGFDGDQARIEIRSDDTAVSGDIFRLDRGQETWVAGFRSAPESDLAGTVLVLARDRFAVTSEGKLVLAPDGDEVAMSLTLSAKLDGLPVNTAIRSRLQPKGEALRRVQLETLRETGVPAVPRIDRAGRDYGLADALWDAGIELVEHGHRDDLPAPPSGGWSEKQLHALMSDFAQSDLAHPGLALRLLWLSKSNRDNLLGVMFDHAEQDENHLPRQGAAVFAGAVRAGSSAAQLGPQLLQTAVHEIGHMLNLVHPFEIDRQRRASLSFMNYDWAYHAGAPAFWRNFAFRFDAHELSFLRHGHFLDVAPGGTPFGAVQYWEHAPSGYPPFRSESVGSGLAVELLPPVDGPIFAFAQQVILGLRFTNRSDRMIAVQPDFLDPKAGGVEVVIERKRGGIPHAPSVFRPMTRRCTVATRPRRIAAGETVEDNVNLTFGAAGFPFAEPGTYRVTVHLHLETRGVERIVRSPALRIRILSPASREEDRAALDLLEPSAGAVLALGGTAAYEAAASRLMETANRLSAAGGWTKPRVHPVATGIYRALGFHYQRQYVRYRDGAFSIFAARPDDARRCVERIDAAALKSLDPISGRATRAFLDSVTGQASMPP